MLRQGAIASAPTPDTPNQMMDFGGPLRTSSNGVIKTRQENLVSNMLANGRLEVFNVNRHLATTA
jgi:hypothetical protein